MDKRFLKTGDVSPAADGVLTGLAVSVIGLVATIAAGTWRIAGVVYTNLSPLDIALPTADTINSRIDLIYADAGGISAIAGIPGPNPVKPILPDGAIEVGFVLVTPTGTSAGTVAPAGYVTTANFNNTVGDMDNLATGAKNNLVEALNEVNTRIGALNQDNVILKIFKKTNYS